MPPLTTRVEVSVCHNCHQEFYSARKGTKYCTDACKLADWRAQHEQRS